MNNQTSESVLKTLYEYEKGAELRGESANVKASVQIREIICRRMGAINFMLNYQRNFERCDNEKEHG